MRYNIISTKARAMGNAYLVKDNCENLPEYVILCDYGIMGLRKALAERHMNIIDCYHINNLTADRLQRDGMNFFEIEEA